MGASRLDRLTLSLMAMVLATGILPGRVIASPGDPAGEWSGMAPPSTGRLARLRIMDDVYPKAWFFRLPENAAKRAKSYEWWEGQFEGLMGIEGKALDETIVGRSSYCLDFFTRFKRRHPDQLVLLHFDADTRDPAFDHEPFYDGHWLYYNGTTILSEVPATAGENEIRVADPDLFRTNIGPRFLDRVVNDDIGLCDLDATGRPDWSRSEQVQLVAIDRSRGLLRVRRGCYGTAPRAFAAGRAYAAAHSTFHPAGKDLHLCWRYNYSTRCPRDSQGHNCYEVQARYLARQFQSGGQLADFDGIQFDVLFNNPMTGLGGREADCDGDGRGDQGMIDGINTFGTGVIEFLRQLRAGMGEDRLILADDYPWPIVSGQRACGLINGVESEGFCGVDPRLGRCDWSTAMNGHFFWNQNSRPPALNYINYVFRQQDEKGAMKPVRASWNLHRLVCAAALMGDRALAFYVLPSDEHDRMTIWDEMKMGAENRLGWLGRPLGPPTRLALIVPDQLAGAGRALGDDLLCRMTGEQARFAPDGDAMRVWAKDPRARTFAFTLTNLTCAGPDLTIVFEVWTRPMTGYPIEMARLMRARLVTGGAPSGEALSKSDEMRDPGHIKFWINQDPFEAVCYFNDITGGTAAVEFTVESAEPLWIRRMTAHTQPDAMARQFEHGLVLANPSPRPYTFDLEIIAPGRRFQRLQGTPGQDPA
ncbi:MAG: hypothetical protein M1457_07260, partial [bacterium]|nr:hypothetical protein [bacterium]